MDIYQAINENKYKNTVPFPDKPKKPAEPKIPVHLLSQEEFDAIKRQGEEYESAMKRFVELKKEWYQGEADAINQFWDDVAAANNIDPKDPFFARMTGLAWERGHSAGLHDVYGAFLDLLPLYELYRDKK